MNSNEKKDNEGIRMELSVYGKTFPAYLTNGALLRFRERTGHDLETTDGGFSDTFTLLWCCVASACKREGVKFDMTVEDFADATTPADIEQWAATVFGKTSEGKNDASKKK